MGKVRVLFLAMLPFFVTVDAPSQTYSVIYNLGSKSGDPVKPQNSGAIAQGRGGDLFSTTPYGGSKNFGAVFRISSAGQLITLFSFTNGSNGGRPYGGLTLGIDGNFYGTTSQGGTRGAGTVFKITSTGSITTLYVFTNGSDGAVPWAPPIQGTDGNFYGTASKGGGHRARMDVARSTSLRHLASFPPFINSIKHMGRFPLHLYCKERMEDFTGQQIRVVPTGRA